eukprot:scaffold657960_cov88-Prasinocladus_malaysianus.AAC.1
MTAKRQQSSGSAWMAEKPSVGMTMLLDIDVTCLAGGATYLQQLALSLAGISNQQDMYIAPDRHLREKCLD